MWPDALSKYSYLKLKILLPTAQWFPRGYILPTTTAGLSEQYSMQGIVARIIKNGQSGLQVHE